MNFFATRREFYTFTIDCVLKHLSTTKTENFMADLKVKNNQFYTVLHNLCLMATSTVTYYPSQVFLLLIFFFVPGTAWMTKDTEVNKTEVLSLIGGTTNYTQKYMQG